MGLGRGPIGYPLACWSSAFDMSNVTGRGSVGPVEGVLRDVSKGTEILSHCTSCQIIQQEEFAVFE